MSILERFAQVYDLESKLKALVPSFIAAAQAELNEWHADEDGIDEVFGSGGACDTISRALADVITKSIPEAEIVDGGQDGDDHAYIIVHDNKNAFIVDIPANVYETGGGYSWKKKPDVELEPGHLVIERVEFQPEWVS